MLFKECFKIHIIEYRANQGNVFPKKSSYCKDHAIQGFVNQGPTVYLYVQSLKLQVRKLLHHILFCLQMLQENSPNYVPKQAFLKIPPNFQKKP